MILKSKWSQVLKRRARRLFPDQSGSVIVITAVSMLMIMGFACLAVDLGHLYMVKSELQRAADATALAGARGLFPFPWGEGVTFNLDCPNETVMNSVAQANPADGTNPGPLVLSTLPHPRDANYYTVGNWNFNTNEFNQTTNCTTTPYFTNAVRVTITRLNVPLIFIGALGLGRPTIQATATAALGFGGGGIIALWDFVYQNPTPYLDENGWLPIYLSSDPADIGSWAAVPPNQPNASYLNGVLDDPSSAQLTGPGNDINLQNGVLETVLHTLEGKGGGRNFLDPPYTFLIPIVDTDKFIQESTIINYAAFTITEIGKETGPPDKGEKPVHWYIKGTLNKDLGSAGVMGRIRTVLVQ